MPRPRCLASSSPVPGVTGRQILLESESAAMGQVVQGIQVKELPIARTQSIRAPRAPTTFPSTRSTNRRFRSTDNAAIATNTCSTALRTALHLGISRRSTPASKRWPSSKSRRTLSAPNTDTPPAFHRRPPFTNVRLRTTRPSNQSAPCRVTFLLQLLPIGRAPLRLTAGTAWPRPHLPRLRWVAPVNRYKNVPSIFPALDLYRGQGDPDRSAGGGYPARSVFRHW